MSGSRRGMALGAVALLTALLATAAVAGAGAGGTESRKTGPRKPADVRGIGAARAPGFAYARGVGMVRGTHRDSLWLLIAEPNLAPGESLTLIADDPDPDPEEHPAVFAASVAERIAGQERRGWSPPSGADGMFPESTDVWYRLAAPVGALDCCILGYAVRAPRSAIRIVAGRPEADLDGDGTVERFQSCASHEGLHLTVWSGEPIRSASVWSRYYYVPYALEPTCFDPDTLKNGF